MAPPNGECYIETLFTYAKLTLAQPQISKLHATFGLRAIELSVHHFRFHCCFRCTPAHPRQAPAWVLCAEYCILRPFHIVLLPCCLSLALSAEFNCVLSVWRWNGDKGGGTPKGGGGKLLTPSTNGNELVLHCATWPAANLIQLVGIGMRLNGIYLFNCRAPRSMKPFLLNHFTQIESQLALQLELHHSMCHAVGVFQPAAGIVWLFRKTGK